MNLLKPNEQAITHWQRMPNGVNVVVHNVPAIVDIELPGGYGFRSGVVRYLEQLYKQVKRKNPKSGEEIHLEYQEKLEANEEPDPISLEIARALKVRGLSQAELAQRLGVRAPVVSRLTSPRYHGHTAESLRRVALALNVKLEVKLIIQAAD